MKRFLTLMIFPVLMFSCKTEEKDSVETIRFQSGTQGHYISEYKVLKVPEDILVGEVAQSGSDDDYIYILNAISAHAGVYVFDKVTGEFVSKAGRRGRGTGEYILPLSFTLRNNSLYIVDAGAGCIMEYSRTGFDFIGKRKIDNIEFFEWINDSTVLSNNYDYGSRQDRDKAFIISDEKFRIRGKAVEKPVISNYVNGPLKPVYRQSSSVRAYVPNSCYVYEVSGTTLFPVYELSFENLSFPEDDYLQKISRGGRDYTKDLRESGYISYCECHETENAIVSFCMAAGKRYLGLYNKNSKESYLLDEDDMEAISPRSPFTIAGICDCSLAVVLFPEEIEDIHGNYPGLDQVLMQCDSNDIVLQMIDLQYE